MTRAKSAYSEDRPEMLVRVKECDGATGAIELVGEANRPEPIDP